MVVRLEHVLDADPVQAAELEIGFDRPLGVDDRGNPGAGVPDQIRGAAQVLVQDLPKEHS